MTYMQQIFINVYVNNDRYLGTVDFTDEEVVGIILDKWHPNASNGSVKGKQYFRAPPGRGYFANRRLIIEKMGHTSLPDISRFKDSRCPECNGEFIQNRRPHLAYDGIGIVCDGCSKSKNDFLHSNEYYFHCGQCEQIDYCIKCMDKLSKTLQNKRTDLSETEFTLKMDKYAIISKPKLSWLEADNQRLKNTIDECGQRMTENQRKITDLTRQDEKLRNSNVELQRRLQRMQSNHKTEMDELKKDLSGTKEELMNVRSSHQTLESDNDKLMKETKALNQKLYDLRDYTQNIHALNVEELDRLKQRFEYKLSKIAEAREKIYENEVLCMICMDNHKDILIQGCNHYVLCHICEGRLVRKICPQCQRSYSNVIRVSR